MLASCACFATLAILNEGIKRLRACYQEEDICSRIELSRRSRHDCQEQEEQDDDVSEHSSLLRRRSRSRRLENSRPKIRVPTSAQMKDVLLYFLQTCINAVIMLAVMGYSVYILIAATLGKTIGSLIFPIPIDDHGIVRCNANKNGIEQHVQSGYGSINPSTNVIQDDLPPVPIFEESEEKQEHGHACGGRQSGSESSRSQSSTQNVIAVEVHNE